LYLENSSSRALQRIRVYGLLKLRHSTPFNTFSLLWKVLKYLKDEMGLGRYCKKSVLT
jgi:hypothetical protein